MERAKAGNVTKHKRCINRPSDTEYGRSVGMLLPIAWVALRLARTSFETLLDKPRNNSFDARKKSHHNETRIGKTYHFSLPSKATSKYCDPYDWLRSRMELLSS
jgi:hypothetical protein